MTKQNGNHDGRNEKGENWPKFLKEMQTLVPALHRAGHIGPQNREEARAMGAKSAEAFMQKEYTRLAEEQRFRAAKVAEWFDKTFKEVAPRIFALVEKRKWHWVIGLFGYRLDAEEGYQRVEWRNAPIPFTLCTIKRWGRLVKGFRMFWEDPNPPKPKSRIIKP